MNAQLPNAPAPARPKIIHWAIGRDVYECSVEERACPFCCKQRVVVALPAPFLAVQPDGTTHVCHPSLGGCNQGFADERHKDERAPMPKLLTFDTAGRLKS